MRPDRRVHPGLIWHRIGEAILARRTVLRDAELTRRLHDERVDVTLPVVVPIEWAGDTPMVSITDFEIPGLGNEFGARVLFYDERYAGTWDHGEYGGLMYGTIEKLD